MLAIDRYDGPMWRTLRNALSGLTAEQKDRLDIWFLSGYAEGDPDQL
ncbi:hypothetical protein AA11825_2623 [Acetobacter pomorum DSM 11825]|nr:hypothetical protein [Acetobacter pomorum]GBR54221.1 hypothetical protein AA11825_2623 [Acetobacter pomorum DSM 11825]